MSGRCESREIDGGGEGRVIGGIVRGGIDAGTGVAG